MEVMKLNFYKLESDVHSMGRVYPQIQQVSDEGTITLSRQILRNWDRENLIEENLLFDRFIIEKSAKKTDYLSSAPLSMGRIFSNKIVRILSDFNLPRYRVYSAVIQKKGTDILYEGYYFFLLEKLMYCFLSYSEMIFSDDTEIGRYLEVRIKDVEEYKELRDRKNRIINLADSNVNIIFNNKFPQDVDLFAIGGIDCTTHFVSERLMNAFKEERVSGFLYKKIDNLYCRM